MSPTRAAGIRGSRPMCPPTTSPCDGRDNSIFPSLAITTSKCRATIPPPCAWTRRSCSVHTPVAPSVVRFCSLLECTSCSMTSANSAAISACAFECVWLKLVHGMHCRVVGTERGSTSIATVRPTSASLVTATTTKCPTTSSSRRAVPTATATANLMHVTLQWVRPTATATVRSILAKAL